MGNTHDAQIARIEADLLGRYQTIEDYRWSYTKDRGPDTWWIHYPSAAGGNQSPVDIPAEDVQFDHDLCIDPLRVSYVSPVHEEDNSSHQVNGNPISSNEVTDEDSNSVCEDSNTARAAQVIVNNGNTIYIDFRQSNCHITGGPLKDNKYVLKQVHLHWGENDNSGSEHLINGRPHSAEAFLWKMLHYELLKRIVVITVFWQIYSRFYGYGGYEEVHLLHWNDTVYDNFEEATRRDDGIAIIAVFVKIGEGVENEGLQLISKLIDDVLYRDQEVGLTDLLDAQTLLPDDTEKYWSYRGSFTTPPCYETVTWILFAQPISVNSQTLNKFRQLRSYCENETRPDDEFEGQIVHNTRPVQPLGTRKVITVDTVALRLHSLESSDRYVTESLSPHAMPFPELFDQKRRDELFQWIQ